MAAISELQVPSSANLSQEGSDIKWVDLEESM